MPAKRIVFSTATPNDQGGIIENGAIDFSRYKLNPVILCQHAWEKAPIGLMTDIRIENSSWTGLPVFHRLTQESKDYADMYAAGFLRACSIGGDAAWETNSAGQVKLDKDGNRSCEKFMLYEISMVTLPSNPEAVQELEAMAPKFYDKDQLPSIAEKMTALSSTYYPKPIPSPMKKTPAQLTAEKALKEANDQAASEETARLSALQDSDTIVNLPQVIKDAIRSGFKTVFGTTTSVAQAAASGVTVPEPKDLPTSSMDDPTKPQPKPTGLAAKEKRVAKAKKVADEAKVKAAKAVDTAKSAKEKSEADNATDEDKDAYKEASDEMEKAVKEAQDSAVAYKKAQDAPDDDDDDDEDGKGDGKSTNAAKKPETPVIKLKTLEQLKAEAVNLAPKPQIMIKRNSTRGVPFSKFAAAVKKDDGSEECRILSRVMAKDAGAKDITDYAIILNSIMDDGRFSAITEKIRFIQNINEGQLASHLSGAGPVRESRAGLSAKKLADKLNSGYCDVMGRNNVMERMTTLTATDTFLGSPDLLAVEFLSLAIFALFPSSGWKADVPVFGAELTGANTGIIWANVAANPAIYKGTQPSNPATYNYTDTAVALNLTPYWLQPMGWTPLTMHQLRYDMMSTGWAQAFALWNSIMDDEMLYTLASTVPAGSIIPTVGQALVPNFTLSGINDPNSFYYNPSLVATLATPAYTDITRIEQIYNKQNFMLENEKSVLVIDPTMEAFMSTDPDTKSLLTRWIQSDQSDLLKIKHTVLSNRSRVAIWDPATVAVKDPNSAIPATAISAGLGFLPSQVGIGLGKLDVFMLQDPTNYGYKMSADIRQGIVPLRANYNGVILYIYGPSSLVA